MLSASHVSPGVNAISAMPVTAALHLIGQWSIRLLLLTLAITPFCRIAAWPRLMSLRRLVGLSAFFYVAIHFALYLVQQNYRLSFVVSEIIARVYLTIGFIALVGLLVLAVTSNDWMVRKLSGKRWQRIHYLVYPLTALALTHFFMQSKINITEPMLMGGLFIWLMLYRAVFRWHKKRTISLLALGVLSVAAAILTMAGEVLWYELATGIGAERILNAIFDFRHIRPAWWVLLTTLIFVPLRWAADKYWSPRRSLAHKAVE